MEGRGEGTGRKPASHADLEALPPNVVGELIDGALYVSPRPLALHAVASFRLGAMLGRSFDLGEGGHGGWRIVFKPGLHLGEDVVVPDVAGWRRKRVSQLPRAAAFDVAPDWTCELITPCTAALDREAKLPVYAREGVSHVWLVNPEERTMEVLRLEQGRYALVGTYGSTACVRAEPFDALDLELSLLWG